MKKDKRVYTFQDGLDEVFRKDSVQVKLSFQLLSERTLTADCFQNDLIKITCIEEN
ncbi:hypothetical protein [Maribacter sp. 2210JD10-5]|uniref:hypothetical protein n=1 Tax=Maribacter sp. 2210JD10-5 TaxID=3386272 RepID=UPI0039BCFEB8